MPKRIDNVFERAVGEARRRLSGEGGENLTIREIAAACGVAVGTMYNYFPSKEYLIGCVVSEDWQAACQSMRQRIDSASGMEDGVFGIYEAMFSFAAEHRYLTAFSVQRSEYAQRHMMLCQQLRQLLVRLLDRFGQQLEEDVLIFLAESIIYFSINDYPYPRIAAAVRRLLPGQGEKEGRGTL